ncbi:hypothetical protein LBMAG42_34940 [Deltaproteobacteria bacterium]|nr:hypothetical protein LBMAG42_34940 [Deltaproteobacteria bacterium]
MMGGWARVRAATLHSIGPVLLIGVILGLAVAIQPKLTLAALVGLALGGVGVVMPPALVAFMFLGMLMDRAGVTGMKLGAFPVTASKLSVLGGIGMWLVHAGIYGARPLRWHPVLTAMAGVIGTMAVCIAYANSMAEGKFSLYGVMMMTVMVALVYASLAEASLTALYRFLSGIFLLALLASVRGPGSAEGGRVAGTMGDPNEWATMVLLLAPFLLGGLADDDHGVARLLRTALVALAPLAILRSESRTALVVGTLISPACLYVLRRHRGELAFCGGAALFAAPFVIDLDTALHRFNQLVANLQGAAVVQDQSLEERSELFRQGVQLFKDHWFIGAGPGNFSTATGFVSHTGSFRPAHNTYLEIASEQGIVGLTPTIIFLWTVAASLRAAWKDATRDEDRNRIVGVAAGLGALALMAATLGLLTFSMAYLVLGFGLAVVYQARRE